MFRTVPVLMSVLVLGCGGDESVDPTKSTPTDDDGTPTVDTIDTADDPTGTPWADLVAPPTDVQADCWSWAAEVDAGTGEPWNLSLGTYDPGTLATLTSEYDYDPDRVMDMRWAYTWDTAFAEILRYEADYDLTDVALDYVVEQEFDPVTGYRTLYREDSDGDGVFDLVWTYVYDLDLLVEAHADDDGDGLVDTWWRYTYDAEDRPLTLEGDAGDDGTIDHLYVYVHDDSAPGRAWTRTYDDDMDGYPEETASYVYDELDQRTYYQFANDEGDEYTYTYTYNADGDRETYTQRTVWDGEFNDTQSYTYSYLAPGKRSQVVLEIDFTDDGAPEATYIETWTWSCP